GTVGPCLPVGNSCIVSSLDGAAGVAVSPAGGHVYVASAGDSAVAVFERAGAPPAFSFVGGRPGQSPPQPVRNGDPVAPSGVVDGIESTSAVAVSGDGRCLFALGLGDKAIAAFRRDAASGELHFAGRWRDGDAGVDGLEGPTGLDVFGASVYVTSSSVEPSENALAVFRHETDPASPNHCRLTPVEVERDGQNGVSGLFGASAVAVSGDGAHVYVASRYPGAVAVFSRSGIDGAVTFVERKESGVAGVTGLRGAHGVAISTDGEHVYAAASVDDAIVAFRRGTDAGDPATFGRLTQIQVVQDSGTTSPVPGAVFVAGLDRVIGLATSLEADGPGSRNLYAASQIGDALLVFGRNADDASPEYGRLSLRQSFFDGAGGVDGLGGARAVRVSRDGKNVYVAGEDDDALAVFSREEVGGTLTFVEAQFDGVGGVDGLDQAYGVAVSPSGRFVYVAGLGDDAIAAFGRVSASRCTGSGVGNLVDTVDIAAGGRLLYTVTATVDPAAVGLLVNDATVTVLGSAVTEPPAVHEAGACPDNPPGSDNNFCRDVDQLAPVADLDLEKTNNRTVSVPGEALTYRLTVANDGPSNVVGAVVHDDLSAIFPDGATWSCVAAPSGALAFLASYADGAAQVDPPATLAGLDGASGVAISPDGLHAYVTGLGDDAVAIFAIAPASGDLTFLGAVLDGVGGVEGLDGASAVVASADGAHVYVAARLDDTVLAFTRETDPLAPGFGLLTLLQIVQLDGSAAPVAGSLPVPDLDQPVDLALTPDPDGPGGPLVGGEQLYVAAANANAVVVLARNADPLDTGNYGLLSYVASVRDGQGADGLAGASGVALSPDGLSLYATGANEHALAFFAR
ncbi:MAG TPA: beta-propeller fold lactonase family protein, partial [Thermoleophilia bacterium]|nr:beta-propeller fold lactonase family protein [Thermoleophilia bacterium]